MNVLSRSQWFHISNIKVINRKTPLPNSYNLISISAYTPIPHNSTSPPQVLKPSTGSKDKKGVQDPRKHTLSRTSKHTFNSSHCLPCYLNPPHHQSLHTALMGPELEHSDSGSAQQSLTAQVSIVDRLTASLWVQTHLVS